MDVRLQTRPLRQQRSADEYEIYKAALEWELLDPIVIEKREDFKSEYRWRDRLEPFYHQVTNLITFCRRLPVTLLADDVGLGKTIHVSRPSRRCKAVLSRTKDLAASSRADQSRTRIDPDDSEANPKAKQAYTNFNTSSSD